MSVESFEPENVRQTEQVAAELAATLGPGDVVLLRGELGAGKTAFVRGACNALGVGGKVTSPTYTIGHRYEGDPPVSHLDLYRLASLEDEEPGLLDEYLTPDAITFVEWPDAGAALLEADVVAEVEIIRTGGDARRIEITRG